MFILWFLPKGNTTPPRKKQNKTKQPTKKNPKPNKNQNLTTK